MFQVAFANNAKKILELDKEVIGFAVGGFWITNEIDESSDLDLVIDLIKIV